MGNIIMEMNAPTKTCPELVMPSVGVWGGAAPHTHKEMGCAMMANKHSQAPGPCPIAPRDEMTPQGETHHCDLGLENQ